MTTHLSLDIGQNYSCVPPLTMSRSNQQIDYCQCGVMKVLLSLLLKAGSLDLQHWCHQELVRN